MAGKPVNITIGATVASSLGAAVRDAKNQLGTLGAKISSLNDKKVKVDQLVAMKAQTNDLGRAYGQARKRADELSAAYAAMGPPTAAQTREMRAAEQAAEKAGAALTKQREALRELRASLHSAGVDTRNLGTESVRLGSQLDTLKRRTEALSRARQADKDNRDKRGQHLGNVMSTAAVGMTLAAPLKTAMDFEAQMSRVGAVSNSTKEQQVQLTAKAREMGRDTKFSALEAGQGMEYLAMAGFNANQQMAAIGGVLDVAAAAGTELGRTSDIVSNALTGFGLQADQAGRVGDVLTKTFTGSNTTLESLGETLKYVAPVASSAGASIELVAAMTGVLGDAGIQGSMAGTTLRNTFLRLIAPAKDAQKHMKQLGISAEQMREIMADPEGQQAAHYIKKMGIDVADENGNLRDWMDILTELSVKMGNLSQADRLEAASSIFGKYAVSGGLALLDSLRHDEKYIEEQVKNMREQGATEEEIQKYRLETRNKLQDRYNKNLLASQQGFAKQVAARMLDNTKGEFTILGSAVSDLAIEIGNVLAPAARDSAKNLTSLANKASAFVHAFPVLSRAVLLGVGSILLLSLSAYALGFAWTVLKAPFLKMNVVWQKVRAEQALLRISNAETGASATLLGSKWGAFKSKAGGVGGVLRQIGGGLLSLIPAIGSVTAALLTNPITWIILGIGLLIGGVALTIRKYWEPLSAFFGGVWAGIKAAFAPLLEAFAPLQPLFSAVGDAIGSVVDWFSKLFEPVKLSKEEMSDWAALGQRFGQDLGEGFKLLFTPVQYLCDRIGDIINAIKWLWDNAGKIGDTFSSWSDSAGNYVSEKWTKFKSWSGIGDAPSGEADDGKRASVGNVWMQRSPVFASSGENMPPKFGFGRSGTAAGPSAVAPQPVAGTRNVTQHFTNAPTIQVTVPPGAEARDIADTVERRLMRNGFSRYGDGAAALYDYE